MIHNRINRAATLTGSVLTIVALGACSGHGKYTTEGKELAQERMNMVKASTEWEMAHQEFLSGNLEKAERTIDNAIALSPQVAKSHILKGRIQLEQGDMTAARKSFLVAEEMDEEVAESQYYIGIIHERFDEPSIALQRYKKALELEDDNAQYLIAAAEMLIELRMLDDAEELLRDHRDNFEYDAAVRQTFGHISLLRGEPAEAAGYFEQALLLQPDDLRIVEDLVHAQIQAARFADADVHLVRLIEADENDTRPDLLHLHARCLIALKRPVEARSVLVQLTSGNDGQGDVRAWIELGSVCFQLKDHRRMGRAADRIMAMEPDRYEGYFLKAAWCRATDDLEKADRLSQKAVALTDVDPGPAILRGLIMQDLGQNNAAVESFAAALKINPNDNATRRLHDALAAGSTVAGTEGEY